MSTATDFTQLQKQLATADSSLFLGQLVWYSVCETSVHHSTVVKALGDNGLAAYLPRLPSDVDVFRRVCTAASKNRVATAKPGEYENYLVRDVPVDKDTVRKVIVRETVSGGSEDNLKYETELCTLSFNRTDDSLRVQCIDDVMAKSIGEEVKQAYLAQRGMLNAYAIRELIRRILLSVQAVNVRGSGGGVYFVSQDHAKTLTNLEGFVADLPGTESVMFHTLPLVDDSKQREMVKRAFESETVEEVERLINEIADLEAKSKTISVAKLEAYTHQLDELKAKTKEYQQLLDDKTAMARSSIQIFSRQIVKLMGMVEA